MKSVFRSAAALAMAGVMGAAILTGCGSTKIDGSKTVVTINDEAVDLGVLSFYAKFTQAEIYKYYSAYLGTTGMFDTSTTDSSDATIGTYGESLRKSALTDIEKMVVISQHAADYDVSLTDEEEEQIAEVAKSYIDNNSEAVRDKIGASEEDVKKLLEYQTIQSKMMDPIAADVDTNVTQEEAQQSKVTYVAIDPDSISDDSDSSVSEASSGADSVQEASSSAESTATDDSAQKAQEEAQAILAALQAEADPANADMDAIAKTVDSSLSAVTGHYTTNDTTDGSVDSEVVSAVQGLADGSVVDHVVTGSNGSTLYVVRFDLTDDETYTQTQKESIIRQRKQDNYTEVTDGWMDDATIKVDTKVLNTLTITDEDPITLKDATTSTTESTASSVAEASSTAASVSEDASSVVSEASADSAAVSAAP